MTDELRNPWDSQTDPNTSANQPEDQAGEHSETPQAVVNSSAAIPQDTAHTDESAATSQPAAQSNSQQMPAQQDSTTTETSTSPFRPAPQYGAYAPTSTPATTSDTSASAHTQQTQTIQYGLPYQNQNQSQNQAVHETSQFNTPFGASGHTNANPNTSGDQPTQAGTGIPNPPAGPNMPSNAPMPQGPNNPYTSKAQTNHTSSHVIVGVVAALVAAALCLGLGFAAITNGWVTVPSSGSASSLSTSKSGSGSAVVQGGDAPDWSAVAAKVSDSVVSIQVQTQSGVAQGSGAILDKDGNIVTNNHVVSGATRIVVTLNNGDIYEAKTVGTDSTTDLAVIKLQNPPSDLTPVEFADSDNLTPGEGVMAIGNPLGYDGTVTTGIVSALDRPVTVMDEDNTAIVTNAVQIDAAINPGNSGGPTFNAAGQVIGINSSIATMASGSSSSESSGSIGIGFAIPSNLVKRISEEIIKDGKAQHVALGVTVQSTTVEADGATRGGAAVKAVVSGGPAADAGIKVGDTIIGYDGIAVSDNYSLLGFIRAAAMNSTAKLTIVRDGKTMTVDVKLDKAEDAVNGSNRQDSNSQNNQNQQDDGNSDQQNNNGNESIDPFNFFNR